LRLHRCAWLVLVSLAVGVVAAGCGPTFYTINTIPAASAVAEAEEAGAVENAPYEYWYAHEHLMKAREEASEASYEDAVRYAEMAEEFGSKARELARRRMREMGR